MKHCYGCKVEKEEYLARINASGELGDILNSRRKPFIGNYCYHCALERKKLRERIKYGKTPLHTVACRSCSTVFIQQVGNQVFCSQHCARRHSRANREERRCLRCGGVLPAYAKKYCCKAAIVPKREKIVHPCTICNKPTKNAKFCSRACHTVHQGLTSVRKPKPLKPIIILNCHYCGGEFETLLRTKKYCSKRCFKTRNTYYRKGYEKLREWLKSKRVPKWAVMRLIKLFNTKCPAGKVVGHIIPLHHEQVCGLHVHYNLCYLTPEESSAKGNNFDGTWENESWKKNCCKD